MIEKEKSSEKLVVLGTLTLSIPVVTFTVVEKIDNKNNDENKPENI